MAVTDFIKDFVRNAFAGSGDIADVATESAERQAMQRDLDLISDIREGVTAIRRKCGLYLPQYEKESQVEYKRRLNAAPWRPEFSDALLALSSKPFAKPVTVAESASPKIRALAENIDGRGNNLHVFARNIFMDALADGMTLIYVSYPRKTWGDTLADERRANPRPYWVQIKLANVVSLLTEMRNGREVVTHLRFREYEVVPDGFGEKCIERIRVVEPERFEVWERPPDEKHWIMVDGGKIDTGGEPPTEVHCALLFTGQRLGSLQVRPPLIDLAEMQIELFRAMSRQEEILTYVGSPMLVGEGMDRPEPKLNRWGTDDNAINVGPKTVLFAPPGMEGNKPTWKYIAPEAANVREIREHVASIIGDMRHLAMQPTAPRSSGTVTATAMAIAAAKAHSAIEAWALNLKDALERAFEFTALWIDEKTPTTVSVHTDFGVGLQGVEETRAVLQAHKDGVISKRTTREELQRRGTLGPQFDPEAEDERLAFEQQGLEGEEFLDPRGRRDDDTEERALQ